MAYGWGGLPEAGHEDDRRTSVRRGFAPWVIVKGTVATCLRYRVTGLAAEGAFFAVLSLPPLIFGLAGSIGYVVGIFGAATVGNVKSAIADLARQALTEDSVQRVIVPTLNAVLDQGRADIISIGFVLALWSGSRALNVFIDTTTIMYGLGGQRGIVKTRLLSFTMYVIVLGAGVIVLPLVLAGPSLVDELLPADLDFLNTLYWPSVVLSTSLFLTTLYHLAVPVRTPWRHDLAGAMLTLLMWIGGSFLLRWVLALSIGGTSIYGPLAAPIAVLLWLYLILISALIGAAFNANLDHWLRNRVKKQKPPSTIELVTGPRFDPDPEPTTDPEPATATETLSDPVPDPETDAETDTKTEAANPEVETAPIAEPAAEASSETVPDDATHPTPEHEPEPETSPMPDRADDDTRVELSPLPDPEPANSAEPLDNSSIVDATDQDTAGTDQVADAVPEQSDGEHERAEALTHEQRTSGRAADQS